MDKIYIIEDDENIRNLLKIALEGFGYEAEGFETAEEGLERIKEEVPSLAIFDWMLPGMDGVTAIRKIRQTDGLQELPIMLLTAKEKELDKREEKKDTLTFEDIVVNKKTREVTSEGHLCELTLKEFELLVYLMENQSRVVTRDELLNQVWGYEYDGETRTLDMHIRTLRQKLGDKESSCIKTVRGVGYRLVHQEG